MEDEQKQHAQKAKGHTEARASSEQGMHTPSKVEDPPLTKGWFWLVLLACAGILFFGLLAVFMGLGYDADSFWRRHTVDLIFSVVLTVALVGFCAMSVVIVAYFGVSWITRISTRRSGRDGSD